MQPVGDNDFSYMTDHLCLQDVSIHKAFAVYKLNTTKLFKTKPSSASIAAQKRQVLAVECRLVKKINKHYKDKWGLWMIRHREQGNL